MRMMSNQLDLVGESSLDCSSSSSDTEGELSQLREENRKLRKLAKHYRRKYKNAKERLRNVSSLNIELQKRLFEEMPPQNVYETPPNVSMSTDSDPENCELGMVSVQQFLSEEKFQEAVSFVQDGEQGDSLFVKNLAMAVWGRETLGTRSVTGRRCMAIMHSKPKPPLSPEKLDYIKEKLIERVRRSEPHISQLELGRRVGKINAYIANKINHLNRKPVDPMQSTASDHPQTTGDFSPNDKEES